MVKGGGEELEIFVNQGRRVGEWGHGNMEGGGDRELSFVNQGGLGGRVGTRRQ